jgi:hypothetical protein
MGYRSVVTLGVMKEEYHEHINGKVKEALKDCDSLTESEDAYYFRWDSVKWYEDYEDVKAIANFMDKLDEEKYGFLRLGEEDEDVERMGSPSELCIYLMRDIEVDRPMTKIKEDFFASNAEKFILDKPKTKKKKK